MKIDLGNRLRQTVETACFCARFSRMVLANSCLASSLFILGVSQVAAIEIKATHAYVVDAATGNVLFSRKPDEAFQPGSLSKLMTAEVVFNALQGQRILPEDSYYVSEHAWRTGGAPSRTTTMFAAVRSSVAVDALVQGLIVHMANDAAIILAEGMAGSEQNFARLMNQRAEQLQLTYSNFANPTGFVQEGQGVTARDMTRLAQHIWSTYPQFYALYSQPNFLWNKINQRNKNPILGPTTGADGLITGFTDKGGYAATASAANATHRVFATLSGFETEADRLAGTRDVLRWALENFREKDLFVADQVVGQATVYGGTQAHVSIQVKDKVRGLVPVNGSETLHARIVYDEPLPAPITKGDQVGRLQIWIGDTLSQEVPVFAAGDVEKGTLRQRTTDAIAELLIGWMRSRHL